MESEPRLLVVDSSVAVKWFVHENESGVPAALSLLEGHLEQRHVLAAPAHVQLEVLNALRYRGLSERYLLEAADRLELARLKWFSIDRPLARLAIALACKHSLSIYDAVFAAVALHMDCELITDDRQLLESGACAVRALGDARP